MNKIVLFESKCECCGCGASMELEDGQLLPRHVCVDNREDLAKLLGPSMCKV